MSPCCVPSRGVRAGGFRPERLADDRRSGQGRPDRIEGDPRCPGRSPRTGVGVGRQAVTRSMDQCTTNTAPGGKGTQLPELELRHRRRARCEDRIRRAKDTGLANLPSRLRPERDLGRDPWRWPARSQPGCKCSPCTSTPPAGGNPNDCAYGSFRSPAIRPPVPENVSAKRCSQVWSMSASSSMRTTLTIIGAARDIHDCGRAPGRGRAC
jgi:hypothetical protein